MTAAIAAATSFVIFLLTVIIALFAFIAKRLVDQLDAMNKQLIKNTTSIRFMRQAFRDHEGVHMLNGDKQLKIAVFDDEDDYDKE